MATDTELAAILQDACRRSRADSLLRMRSVFDEFAGK